MHCSYQEFCSACAKHEIHVDTEELFSLDGNLSGSPEYTAMDSLPHNFWVPLAPHLVLNGPLGPEISAALVF